ncbi:hypothetical protein GQX73_g3873 [Xylaria multiplex]|uniref:Cell wall protein PhiA n=1 Tax=Xylaria multiplex TaxID=323545 RepID=A0A7C8MNI6_9PEZI|nr:hypothetical protein GQX73_g3873 [Xylaria multiplex]
MRASTSALLSLAAFAAANPLYGPPNEDITLKVGAGSSLEGYQLVRFANNGAAFPAFVTAAEAAESPSTFYLFYQNYGHFGFYSLNIDINGATYGFSVEGPPEIAQGRVVLIDSKTYGPNIWRPENDSPVFPWSGDSRDFTFACRNDDGHIQLGIYTPGKQPSSCEQVVLEYKAVA